MNDSLEEMLSGLDPAQYEKLIDEIKVYQAAVEREKAQGTFMDYVTMMWPGFVHGRHHALMAKKFEDVASGRYL